jgi:hypothetical protein
MAPAFTAIIMIAFLALGSAMMVGDRIGFL